LTPDTRLQRVPTALWTNAGAEAVVVSGHGEVFLALDGVGTDIWQLLETPVAVRDLVTSLRRRYRVDEAQCLADVTTYLQVLLSHRIVSLVT
jgi:hypothetical protein